MLYTCASLSYLWWRSVGAKLRAATSGGAITIRWGITFSKIDMRVLTASPWPVWLEAADSGGGGVGLLPAGCRPADLHDGALPLLPGGARRTVDYDGTSCCLTGAAGQGLCTECSEATWSCFA